ncbi:MAG: OmpA family protein [Flavobacteriales bacterium]|nr:OmpA family protein [Flavobacteriales bacterium]
MKIFKTILLLLVCIQMRVAAQEMVATETVALFNVIVTSNDKESHINQKFTFLGLNSKKEFKGVTDATGNFSILLPEGDQYRVIYEYFGTPLDYTVIEVPNVDGDITFDFNVMLEAPKMITLDIFFPTGKSNIVAKSFGALDNLVEALNSKEGMNIEIAGHTDNVGDEAGNLRLSKARAEAVREYLINHKVGKDRVTAKGYGQTIPIADNSTEEGRFKNRRTEVRILD